MENFDCKANVFIVGTKADLKDKAQVTKREVLEFCRERNLQCMWISSKEDRNVKEMFYLMAEEIRKTRADGEAPKPKPTPPPTPTKCKIM